MQRRVAPGQYSTIRHMETETAAQETVSPGAVLKFRRYSAVNTDRKNIAARDSRYILGK